MRRTCELCTMLKTDELFVIYGRGVLGNTLGCDVDFVQETDSFHFGVWLHSLLPNGCYSHLEVEKDSVSMFEDSSWILEVIDGVPPLRLRFSMLTQKYLI
jgi:hypothetical protein